MAMFKEGCRVQGGCGVRRKVVLCLSGASRDMKEQEKGPRLQQQVPSASIKHGLRTRAII